MPTASPPPLHVVVMGVAGCGKSAVGTALAERLALPLVEADDFHPPAAIERLRAGEPPTPADHAEWLARLAQELRLRAQGAVLCCCALSRADREVLRAAVPQLHFLHLALTPHQALERMAARTDHFYPPSRVAADCEALQDPAGEPLVFRLDATQHVQRLADAAAARLAGAASFNNA